MGVGELSPLLPAASLGIALFVFFCFLPLFSGLLLHAGKMLRLMSIFAQNQTLGAASGLKRSFHISFPLLFLVRGKLWNKIYEWMRCSTFLRCECVGSNLTF